MYVIYPSQEMSTLIDMQIIFLFASKRYKKLGERTKAVESKRTNRYLTMCLIQVNIISFRFYQKQIRTEW